MALASPLQAQQAHAQAVEPSTGWFPGSLVVRPRVSDGTGVDVTGTPMIVRRDAPAGSENASPEASVTVGYRLPVFRFRDGLRGGPALDVALETGVRSRFALGEGSNGLLNADFRVAIPVGARSGRWESELAVVHVSSHTGDNFIYQHPDVETGASSSNGFEAMALYSVGPPVRVYATGDYNFATAGVETFAGRVGVDYYPRSQVRGAFYPIGGFQATITDLTDRWSFDALAGAALQSAAGELRLAVTAHTGPSSMGQFRQVDERFLGIMIGVAPGLVARSGG